MYALVSGKKTSLPPSAVVQMPGTWQGYFTLRTEQEIKSVLQGFWQQLTSKQSAS